MSVSIEDVIKNDGEYISTSVGVSMIPMLRDRRDTVVIRAVQGRLERFDVALYRRGDNYVLHRVIKVLPDSYVFRGDNCMRRETGVTDADIVGKLDTVIRNDRKISVKSKGYRAYSVMIYLAHPFIYLLHGVKNIFRGMFGKKS